MNEISSRHPAVETVKRLEKKREKILTLSAEQALKEILNSENPVELVQSFSEQDFYFLIHDVGLEDCLPLLSLASNQQWEYIVDAESWAKDRIEMKSLTRWLNHLLNASPEQFIQWFLTEKTDLIELYLYRNIDLRIREHDQDPSDFNETFFTQDNVFYIRIPEADYISENDDSIRTCRREFIQHFIDRLAAHDHIVYQNVLMEISGILPVETEEEAYRLRNVRLAEKGFLPFEDAVGVYQGCRPEAVGRLGKKADSFSETVGSDSVGRYPIKLLERDNLFAEALTRITADDVLNQIQSEFAGLCNRLISADQSPIRYREQLQKIVRKACGYINIGIQCLAGDLSATPDPVFNASLIKTYPLVQLFRVGYGAAANIKRKAEQWRKHAWFLKQGLPLGFWDELGMGVLGGLFLKRPLFFDNYNTGVLYREFASMTDIQATETILNDITAMDDLFSRFELTYRPTAETFVTFKTLLLTLWARTVEGLSEEFSPIPLPCFRQFYRKLFDEDASSISGPRLTRLPMKESILNWMSEKSGLGIEDISQRSGRLLEELFHEIELEYGEVSEKNLDPRFIQLFLVSK